MTAQPLRTMDWVLLSMGALLLLPPPLVLLNVPVVRDLAAALASAWNADLLWLIFAMVPCLGLGLLGAVIVRTFGGGALRAVLVAIFCIGLMWAAVLGGRGQTTLGTAIGTMAAMAIVYLATPARRWSPQGAFPVETPAGRKAQP